MEALGTGQPSNGVGTLSKADMRRMEQEYDGWLDSLDTSHIKPVRDNWKDHPFWADEEDLRNPSTEAGKALANMQAESTPYELAQSCKDAGNEHLRSYQMAKRRMSLRLAVDKYGEGLAHLMRVTPPRAQSRDLSEQTPAAAPDERALRSLSCALCSNRAHVESLLGNWRSALDSANRALRADQSHLKSYFRAARAAQQLGRWREAQELCRRGLEVEAGSVELVRIRRECEAAEARGAEAEARRAAQREAALAEPRLVARALRARGYQVTKAQVGFEGQGGATRLPWIAGDGALHFSALFFYPEAHPYHDMVGDVCETDTVRAHVDEMFAPGAPPLPWDEAGSYVRERLQLYYCSHMGTPLREEQLVDVLCGKYPERYVETGCQKYGTAASRMCRVDEAWTFQELLRAPGHVMPAVPVVFVVAEGTPYAARFLEACGV